MAKYELNDEDVRRIRQMWHWLTHFSGVTRTPFGMSVAFPSQERTLTPSAQQEMLLKVTGNATGGGKYTGRVMNLNSSTAIPLTGNLSEAEIGTAGDTDVLILNTFELGQSTHDLTTGTPKSKYFWGRKLPVLASDGKSVYIINAVDWETCT